MKIKFRSEYNQSGQDQITEFEADANYLKQKIKHLFDNEEFEYDIYEFKDPQSNKLTRIELNPLSVNVISDNATLQLRLNKYHSGSQLNLNKNKFVLKTFMNECFIKEQQASFSYELFSVVDQPMGRFKVFIEYK
ncbi:hypothetical protein EG856_03255 [Mycoplasmopsis phocirhinis]|uniref:Uncharacterized protein n=1 Tax=Mycoplasmopsis phocirhinis TaxID=142650 RepID=A0A4P6MU18_9BACT|nr:hypothetical protein [Mycoplasmopsis phocirhinis]QBF34907.1 hypothetical protein EG856_03255 [Mycoplasmopsis phocirhinis]